MFGFWGNLSRHRLGPALGGPLDGPRETQEAPRSQFGPGLSRSSVDLLGAGPLVSILGAPMLRARSMSSRSSTGTPSPPSRATSPEPYYGPIDVPLSPEPFYGPIDAPTLVQHSMAPLLQQFPPPVPTLPEGIFPEGVFPVDLPVRTIPCAQCSSSDMADRDIVHGLAATPESQKQLRRAA